MELHAHLEDTIQLSTMIEWDGRHKLDLPFKDEEGFNNFYELTSLIPISRICSTQLEELNVSALLLPNQR